MSDTMGRIQTLENETGRSLIAPCVVTGLCIKSPLVGWLGIAGLGPAGEAVDWHIPRDAVGFIEAPGTGAYSAPLLYVYGTPAEDCGKAFIVYAPT